MKMKLQVENIAGASTAKSKVFTVNMETGKICKEKCDELIENCTKNYEINDNEQNFRKTEQSSVRLLRIIKSESGACGFHLTRTKWDPYPWVSDVDANSPAEICGLKAGDCVLEVNGEDVLGLRITDIAKLVKAKSRHVTLLLWSAGSESTKCEPESLCDGPMPRTLQRLSIIVQSILSIIECPVCLDTIPPPAMQCQNGHLLCVNCRIRAEKCPVCRDRYTPRRALIAEQIYAAITSAFNLCRSEDKLRQKLFGTNVQHPHQQQHLQQHKQQYEQQQNAVRATTAISEGTTSDRKSLCRSGAEVCKSKVRSTGGVSLPTNKFLTKLLLGKACSMDSPSSTGAVAPTTTATTMTQTEFEPTLPTALSFSSASPRTPPTTAAPEPGPRTGAVQVKAKATTIPDGSPLTTTMVAPSTLVPCSCIQSSPPLTVRSMPASTSDAATVATRQPAQQTQSGLNQLHDMATSRASNTQSHTVCSDRLGDSTPTTPTSAITTGSEIKNRITQVNGMSKHFSLSNNDLRQRRLQLEASALDGVLMTTKIKRRHSLDLMVNMIGEYSPNAVLTIPTYFYKRSARKPRIDFTSPSHCPSNNSYETLSHSGPYAVSDTSLQSSAEILLSTSPQRLPAATATAMAMATGTATAALCYS